ncbi:MAG TPA: alpha/beta fold hydrolase [Solirubrobacteraceae bacterium]|nr:alpha/beta fold hydrolase [Solirubrobacteraceae bacterium]
MERIDVGGRTLAVEARGSGEPVLLLHTGFVADGMRPLLEDDRLANGRRLIAYHRRGYGRSDPHPGSMSIEEQAADAVAVMDALGVGAADVAGHSLGATIALELALAAPHRVRRLVIMEPLLLFALSAASAQVVMDVAAVALPRFEQGDHAGALDAWLTGAFGEGYRAILEAALPGAFDQAVTDAPAAFGVEIPALQSWPRGLEDLRRITPPALVVMNAGPSWPGFAETQAALLDRLPHAEGAVVPCRTHLLQMEDPAPVAAAIAGFVARPARAGN